MVVKHFWAWINVSNMKITLCEISFSHYIFMKQTLVCRGCSLERQLMQQEAQFQQLMCDTFFFFFVVCLQWHSNGVFDQRDNSPRVPGMGGVRSHAPSEDGQGPGCTEHSNRWAFISLSIHIQTISLDLYVYTGCSQNKGCTQPRILSVELDSLVYYEYSKIPFSFAILSFEVARSVWQQH